MPVAVKLTSVTFLSVTVSAALDGDHDIGAWPRRAQSSTPVATTDRFCEPPQLVRQRAPRPWAPSHQHAGGKSL